MSKYVGKKILLVGAGASSLGAAKFLMAQGAQVTVTDKKSREDLGFIGDQLEELGVQWDLKGHSLKAVTGHDLIVFSPGVNQKEKAFEPARQRGTPMIGELELAYQQITDPIIAITGTNGKSTVTKLVYEFLKASNIKTWIGGNFGPPLIDYVNAGEKGSVLVCEVSSFQLETIDTFRPHVSIVTNLAEDHLDRYPSVVEYIAAKKNIFRNSSPESVVILNADDSVLVDLAKDPNVRKNKLVYFSRRPALEEQIKKIGGAVSTQRQVRVYVDGQLESYSLLKSKMMGGFVVDNVMASIIAARKYGATPVAIQKVLDSFSGLEHRLEYVCTKGGVLFYNDSKATNVHAMKCALESFPDPVILIAGGRDKNQDFAPIAPVIKKKVKNLILVGEAKEKLNRSIGDFSETFIIGTFEEAILVAYQKSRRGDVVLFSPGCSSYDQFKNYEARGKYFKELIQKF